ncbi:MAG TPA: nucleoside triphosphate pyrophosphatase [Geminicoccaceae bacterium]|nr:nucleoside triphosphate pyrophosphatase [Geminicoccaceae bacterium]
MPVPLVLASSSPRRLAMLRQAGIEPARLEAPQIDEAPVPRELPRDHALRLAEAKNAAVAARLGAEPALVLAADTVVACGRRILPKTIDAAEAERCLRLLSGRRHRVYTGVVASAPSGRAARVVLTVVRFKRLHDDEIAWYLASGEWRGKAGGYAIQGRAEAFVASINGSWSNVVGLPLAVTLDLLRGLGWRPAG